MQAETRSNAARINEPFAAAAKAPPDHGRETGASRTPDRADAASRTVELRIRRQDGPTTAPYWQSFRLEARPGANIVSLLMDLREHCVTASGEPVDPVAFEHNCMEEVCGACAMLINGVPRPACSALIADLETPIRLEPLPKFPVVRDLMVDRAQLFAQLKRVKAWIRIDGAWDNHERAPRISPQDWAANYLYSRCMSCGCCLAACPQFGPDQAFVGPASLAQVRLMNAHPTGRHDKAERLHAIMADGGLSDCGNAQNCVRVCPKEIPLTTAIGELGRQTTVQALKDLFGGR
ncbi:succinate dehydrogenase iron-sulfur subunit [Lamprobacter modestohalophilus]|uniref:succinate dehydrogenase n=1 Tax=Lamprobacter modestohalophilus TaxID=1064514 RepID=A0A9X0WA55_9GAMM|nr:succinate dehydrogenase iron-sulfur subunit [Lamprobacter modestohalophilus]MBK1619098.1 succinate dehydrogenase iron-sulfur subunit [Lamprobacter modestohalophilus]